jgi:hypothetical protein
MNSDYAGHRLTFVQFQSPHFAHLNAVYNAFDFSGPLDFVQKAAGLWRTEQWERYHCADSASVVSGERGSARCVEVLSTICGEVTPIET